MFGWSRFVDWIRGLWQPRRDRKARPSNAVAPRRASRRKPVVWHYHGLTAREWTRSEARARFKAALGLNRLPAGERPQRVSA